MRTLIFLILSFIMISDSSGTTLVVNEFEDDGVAETLGTGVGALFADSIIKAIINEGRHEVLDLNTIKALNEVAKATGGERTKFDYLVCGAVTSCTMWKSESGIKISSKETTTITITTSVKVIDANTGRITYCKIFEGESTNVNSSFGLGSLVDLAGDNISKYSKNNTGYAVGENMKYVGNNIIGDLRTSDPNNPYNIAARDAINKIVSDITATFK